MAQFGPDCAQGADPEQAEPLDRRAAHPFGGVGVAGEGGPVGIPVAPRNGHYPASSAGILSAPPGTGGGTELHRRLHHPCTSGRPHRLYRERLQTLRTQPQNTPQRNRTATDPVRCGLGCVVAGGAFRVVRAGQGLSRLQRRTKRPGVDQRQLLF